GHVRFGHRDRVRDLREQHRHAGSQQDAELAPCHPSAGLVLLSIFLKVVLIAHIRSLSRLLDVGHSNLARDTLYLFASAVHTYHPERRRRLPADARPAFGQRSFDMRRARFFLTGALIAILVSAAAL